MISTGDGCPYEEAEQVAFSPSDNKHFKVLLSVVTTLAIGSLGLGQAFAVPAAPHSLQLSSVADTYVAQTAPATNYGASVKLVADNEPGNAKTTLLEFSVAGLPAGSTISQAHLVLTRDNHHMPSSSVSLYALTSANWNENTVTYASAPTLGSLIGSVATNAGLNTVSFDLGKTITGNGIYALAITSPVTNDVVRFNSRETKNGPQLKIGYDSRPVTVPSTTTTSAKPTAAGTATASADCTLNAILVPTCGILTGVVPDAFTSNNGSAGLAAFEQASGKTENIYHAYNTNDQLFPTADQLKIAQNHILFENWKVSTSDTWAQVAQGKDDARIDTEAAYLKANFDKKFFLTIWHEPENDVVETAGSGMEASDYGPMFAHVINRLRGDGVTNIVTVMDYMGYEKWDVEPWFNSLYPGDSVVDWIGEDHYIFGYNGSSSADFTNDLIDKRATGWNGFYNWLETDHPGKPLMLAEWGAVENASNSQAKPNFLNSIGPELSSYPDLKAMIYFNTPGDQAGRNTLWNSSAPSATAFKSLMSNPVFDVSTPNG